MGTTYGDTMDRLPLGELSGDAAQKLVAHWDFIDRQEQELFNWLHDNPRPEYGDPAAYGEWHQAHRARMQQLGLPHNYSHGRIRWGWGTEATCFIDLEPMVCSMFNLPDGLNRLSRCRACEELFLTTRQFGGRGQCGEACDAVMVERVAERKRQARKQKSAELANRTGRCHVCGDLFQVKRKTARTCSERCKKQAQRHPDRYVIAGPPTHLEPEDCEFSLDRLLEIATACHEETKAKLGFSLAADPSELPCYRHDGGPIPLEQYVHALQETWITATGTTASREVDTERSRAAAMLTGLELFRDAPAVWLAGESAELSKLRVMA